MLLSQSRLAIKLATIRFLDYALAEDWVGFLNFKSINSSVGSIVKVKMIVICIQFAVSLSFCPFDVS